ncbi:hypothetical protein [Chromobacterium vaccinii]|uniref:hypothetical protein n=1 Tax=Chromobacterium vaccinii TaxID=1108595 RepID=UPI001E41610C|nr:hypothetical protein [Chromobacterium vaccinii]MCD4498192.1 hypothetical protein [Chromobacterium vaccinii]
MAGTGSIGKARMISRTCVNGSAHRRGPLRHNNTESNDLPSNAMGIHFTDKQNDYPHHAMLAGLPFA